MVGRSDGRHDGGTAGEKCHDGKRHDGGGERHMGGVASQCRRWEEEEEEEEDGGGGVS